MSSANGLFYESASVLLTGATGFLGKAVLAKLLGGSVGRPAEIFVLVREQRGTSATDRVQDICASSVFDTLRAKLGDAFESIILQHVVVVPGDIAAEKLGLEAELHRQIVRRCNVVLHCAASTSWTEPLVKARASNTFGTLRVLELATECYNRASGGYLAFVHVSSAYANQNRSGVVEEALYEPAIEPETFLRMSEDELSEHEREICDGFSSTYFVSKMMTEHLMAQRARAVGLPLVIVRPSAIGCSWRDFEPGWLEGVMGSNGAVLLNGTGAVDRMVGDPVKIFDVIPVDTVTDAVLSAAVCREDLRVSNCGVPIVHATSSSLKPLLVKEFFEGIVSYFSKHPSTTRQSRKCDIFVDPSMEQFLKHIALQKSEGGADTKALMHSVAMNKLFAPIITREWVFDASNMSLLPSLLSKSGQPFEGYTSLLIGELDWSCYMHLYCYGARRFLLREKNAFRPAHPDAMSRSSAHLRNLFVMQPPHHVASSIMMARL